MLEGLDSIYDEKPNLLSFDRFNIGILGNRATREGNLIGDLLLGPAKDDRITMNCCPEGYLIPALKRNPSGSAYKDLCTYFDLDFVVGLGLFGETETNWRWFLQSYGITDNEDIDGYLDAAEHLWNNYGLVLQEDTSTLECQLQNLKKYQRLTPNMKQCLGVEINDLFNS